MLSSQSTPKYMLKRLENIYRNVHHSIIHKNQKADAIKMSTTNEHIDKTWYSHAMKYYLHTPPKEE